MEQEQDDYVEPHSREDSEFIDSLSDEFHNSGIAKDSKGVLDYNYKGYRPRGELDKLYAFETKRINSGAKISVNLYETDYISHMNMLKGGIWEIPFIVSDKDYIKDDSVAYHVFMGQDSFTYNSGNENTPQLICKAAIEAINMLYSDDNDQLSPDFKWLGENSFVLCENYDFSMKAFERLIYSRNIRLEEVDEVDRNRKIRFRNMFDILKADVLPERDRSKNFTKSGERISTQVYQLYLASNH